MTRSPKPLPAWDLCDALLTQDESEIAAVTVKMDPEIVADCRAAIEALELARGFDGLSGPDTEEPPPLPRLPEDYELGELIGRGGMGTVYRAWQKSLDREVAVKVLRDHDAASRAAGRRFRREATSLAQLRHPHIVPAHEVGEFEGSIYFTMPLIRGESLESRLRSGPLSPSRAVRLVRQIASAVAHAHARGIVHRDLKPGNVLIDENGDAQVVDFGLAIDANREGTVTEGIFGTPAYMSPEQARGQRELVGEPTDIHALGAILYESLTGISPFLGDSVGESLHAVLHSVPPRARSLDRRIPAELELICEKALSKRIDDRYSNVGAFEADLRAFESGRGISIRSGRFFSRAWPDRRRRRLIVAAVFLVAIVAGAAYFAFERGRRTQLQNSQELIAVADRLAEEQSHRAAAEVYDEVLLGKRIPESEQREVRIKAARAWLDAATLAHRHGEVGVVTDALTRARIDLEALRGVPGPRVSFDLVPWLHARLELLSGADQVAILRRVDETRMDSGIAEEFERDEFRTIAFFGERAIDRTHLEHEIGLFAFTMRYQGAAGDRGNFHDRWLLEDPARVQAYALAWIQADWLRQIPNREGFVHSNGFPLQWFSRNRQLCRVLRESAITERLAVIATGPEHSAPVRTLAVALIADLEDLPRGPVALPRNQLTFESTPELEDEVLELHRSLRGLSAPESLRLRIDHALEIWNLEAAERRRHGDRVDENLMWWIGRLLSNSDPMRWNTEAALKEAEAWWAKHRESDPRKWMPEALGITTASPSQLEALEELVEFFNTQPIDHRWLLAHLWGELLVPPDIRPPSWTARFAQADGIAEVWEQILAEVSSREGGR